MGSEAARIYTYIRSVLIIIVKRISKRKPKFWNIYIINYQADVQAALAVRELAVRGFDYSRIIFCVLVLPFAT